MTSLPPEGREPSKQGITKRDLLHYGALGTLLVLFGQRVSESLRIGRNKTQIMLWEKEFGPKYRSLFLQKFLEIGESVLTPELQEKVIANLHRVYVDVGRERPSYGTGFFILPHVMVTARHVVQNREILGVYGNNGDITRGFLPDRVCEDSEHDIAFLIFSQDIGKDIYFDISVLDTLQTQQSEGTIALFAGYGGGYGETDAGLGSVITALRSGLESFESGNIINEKIRALFPTTVPVRGGSSGGPIISLNSASYGKLLGNLIAVYDHDGRTIMSIGLYEKVESIKKGWEKCQSQ